VRHSHISDPFLFILNYVARITVIASHYIPPHFILLKAFGQPQIPGYHGQPQPVLTLGAPSTYTKLLFPIFILFCSYILLDVYHSTHIDIDIDICETEYGNFIVFPSLFITIFRIPQTRPWGQ
jgi:hypothetical protein